MFTSFFIAFFRIFFFFFLVYSVFSCFYAHCCLSVIMLAWLVSLASLARSPPRTRSVPPKLWKRTRDDRDTRTNEENREIKSERATDRMQDRDQRKPDKERETRRKKRWKQDINLLIWGKPRHTQQDKQDIQQVNRAYQCNSHKGSVSATNTKQK